MREADTMPSLINNKEKFESYKMSLVLELRKC